MKLVQPGFAILVVERNAAPNFLDVGGRMKVIRVGEAPALFLGKQSANRRLAAADYSHDDHDHVSPGNFAAASLIGVGLLHARPCVGDSKGAVALRGNLDVLAFAVFLHVSDVLRVDIVVLVGLGGIVELV